MNIILKRNIIKYRVSRTMPKGWLAIVKVKDAENND